ncbi:MFS transporter [Actinoplanes sp. NPDC049265]|uniref:MFS transporter n=1 Tax=Actinoplanes sp. NPDC049265 TaxID=3363902 RepID=UPI003715F75D
MIQGSLAPLRLPAYRAWIIGRATNAFGNSIAPIALAFAVLDISGSASDLGLVIGARTLVNVLFLLFGGALADRVPKNVLMVGASLAAFASQAAVAALVLTHTATIPLLMLLSGVNGMVAALSMPASSAIIPQIIPGEIRQQANALGRLCLNGAMILGAPIGGVLVAAVGPGWGIGVDAATFLLAALCFALIKLPPEPVREPSERTGIVHDLRTGWSEFRSRTWLWAVVASFCVLNASLIGGMFVLGPVIADHTIGRQAWGFVLAAETAGMIVGALIAIRLRVRRLLFLGVACTIFMALPVFVLGVYPHLALMAAAGFVTGVAVEQFAVGWETTMQEHVPGDKLARVYSYDMVGSYLAIPIGQVSVGPLADHIGLRPTLIGLSGLMVLAVAGMLASRDVRHLAHELPKADQPTVTESVP